MDDVEALLAAHLPALRAFVRLRLGPVLRGKEETMDFVQSACREVLVDLDRREIRDEGQFRHWLFEAAVRKIADRARHWNRQRRAAGREARVAEADAESAAALTNCFQDLLTPTRAAVAREELQQFEGAFAKLPAKYQQVILMARIVGLSRAEIGRQLGLREDAVRALLHRALAHLATQLRGSDTQS